MSTSFSNQVLAQVFLAKNKPSTGIYDLPRKLDEEVAALMVQGFGGVVTKLTDEQAEYIDVPKEGPFKEDAYKY